MKKILLGGFSVLMAAAGFAQQRPHYTQYVLNQYVLNPAITGIENYTDIKLSHRVQWSGLQGAPVTTYFTAHTALGKSDSRGSATSMSMEGENPRGKSYWEDYTAAAPHHGVGVQMINDKTGGVLNTFSASLTYAYHLGLTDRMSIAAGFGAGFTQVTLDGAKANFGAVAVDPSVYTSGELRKMRPNLSAGLYLYSSKFFAGLSAQQIAPQRVDFSNNAVKLQANNVLPHLFATVGYRTLIGDDLNLIPSVMIKYVKPAPIQMEFNAKLLYRDIAWVGASIRSSDAVAGMVGLNLAKKLSFGYSYDYGTSNLNNFGRGSHEFLLGFIIGNGYDDSCPKNVW